MQEKKQLIIIGGGASIKEGTLKGLWKKLNNKFVIGLNYSYNYFSNPTIQCFVDNDFYNKNCKDMKHLPLIIGNKKKLDKQLSNTILLPTISKYYRDIKHGVYKTSLVGIFALSLAIHILDEGEIFLLGYDYGETRKSDFTKFIKDTYTLKELTIKDKKNRAITHFYQGDIEHRGIGKINYYNANKRAERDFGVYKKETKVKIYNVSEISKIPNDIFEKISYGQFFKKLNSDTVDQEKLRKIIKRRIK